MFPREGFSLQNMALDVSEGLHLPFFLQHFQQVVQLLPGGRVHPVLFKAFAEIFQRCTIGIIFALVGLTGGAPIHHHFHQILSGHMKGFVLLGFQTQIRPVFIVMAVTALMVDPRFAVSLDLPLCSIGTASALVILCAPPKLRGGIFGQVMGQSLPEQTHPETAPHNNEAVLGNGLKMLPRFHVFHNSLS